MATVGLGEPQEIAAADVLMANRGINAQGAEWRMAMTTQLRAAPLFPEIRLMTRIQERGRARLKLRLPAWRTRFEVAASQSFLDVCEAYELAWIGLEYWTRPGAPPNNAVVEDYREIVASLEQDAQLFAAGDAEAP